MVNKRLVTLLESLEYVVDLIVGLAIVIPIIIISLVFQAVFSLIRLFSGGKRS